MNWRIGIHIVTVLINIHMVFGQTRDEADRGSYQCHCSCSSPYHPDSIVMTTSKLRRQGHMVTMDSVSIQESNNNIKNLLDSAYERLTRTLSDMDKNQFKKIRESLGVKNGGKMPKDMAVTIVDLFKKALYQDENTNAIKKQAAVPDIPKASFTNSNGFVSENTPSIKDKQKTLKPWKSIDGNIQVQKEQHRFVGENMQAVIEKQKTELKQWQKTEQNIKNGDLNGKQQNPELAKAKTVTETKPKTYTLRTLNTLIKSATERLVKLYGKAQAKNRQNSSLGPTEAPNQQAFRNERVTVDEAVRGKPHSSYQSDNHGFWTEEKGRIVGTETKEINVVPTSNWAIGPPNANTNVQEITRTPLTNIITGQSDLNTHVNNIDGIPLSNRNNGQGNVNTNNKEIDSLIMSNNNNNSNNNDKQSSVNTKADTFTHPPLSNSNNRQQDISTIATSLNQGNTPPINNEKKENVSSPLYEVLTSSPTTTTVFVTVEPNPSSIAYYKPNMMSPEAVNSDPVSAINEITGSNLDIKSMLDLSVSEKMSNIGPRKGSEQMSNIGPPKGSEQTNVLSKEMLTGSPTTTTSALDDALFQKISNASPATRSLFTDAMLKEISNDTSARNSKLTRAWKKENVISPPRQGKKSIQGSSQTVTDIGNTQMTSDKKHKQHADVNVDASKQASSSLDILDSMFGNQIGRPNTVNIDPIGVATPEQTIQNSLGNEWDALLKQTPQSFVPSSNLQQQNIKNSAQDMMNISEIYKLLSNLSNNQKIDTHYTQSQYTQGQYTQGQYTQSQYTQSSTTAPNNPDDLAMAMMFGAWKK